MRLKVHTEVYDVQQGGMKVEELETLPDRWTLQGGGANAGASVHSIGLQLCFSNEKERSFAHVNPQSVCWLNAHPRSLADAAIGVASVAWEASVYLSRILIEHTHLARPRLLSHKRQRRPFGHVLELGAGVTALPSFALYAAGLCESCTVTDVPASLQALHHNATLVQQCCDSSSSAPPLDAIGLDWRWPIECTPSEICAHSFDTVFGADVVYPPGVTDNPPDPHNFCHWAKYLLVHPAKRKHKRRLSAGGVCIVALELRGEDILPAFLHAAHQYFSYIQQLHIPCLQMSDGQESTACRHLVAFMLQP